MIQLIPFTIGAITGVATVLAFKKKSELKNLVISSKNKTTNLVKELIQTNKDKKPKTKNAKAK